VPKIYMHMALTRFNPKGHVTLRPAALRVKCKGMRVKNTIFENLGVKMFLKKYSF
jgi:hypothetical protein